MKLNPRGELKIEIDAVASTNAGSVGTVFDGSNYLTIPPEITIDFDVVRKELCTAQEATFRVYNLGEKTRNLIQKDPFVLNEYRAIQFRAGFSKTLPLIFNGFIQTALSYRRGRDFITEITANFGIAMTNGFTSITFGKGKTIRDILLALAKTLPRTAGTPIVGDFPTASKRGIALLGNTWQIIVQASQGLATIDNGQVKILNLNEVVKMPIPLITSESGLLGSPRRTPTSMEFDMEFEPGLTVGQIIQLQSRTQTLYNGQWKVAGFSHSGTVSPVSGRGVVSKVLLYLGNIKFSPVDGNVLQ